MTLYLIGTGLNDEKDISVKGLEAVRNCDKIYLENYTSLINCTLEKLATYYGKEIQIVNRQFVEQTEELIDAAKTKKKMSEKQRMGWTISKKLNLMM